MRKLDVKVIERILSEEFLKVQYVELLNRELKRLEVEGVAGLSDEQTDTLYDFGIEEPSHFTVRRLAKLFGDRGSLRNLIKGVGGFNSARILRFHEVTNRDAYQLLLPLIRQLDHRLNPIFEEYLFNYPPVVRFRERFGLSDEEAEMSPFGPVLELRSFVRENTPFLKDQGIPGSKVKITSSGVAFENFDPSLKDEKKLEELIHQYGETGSGPKLSVVKVFPQVWLEDCGIDNFRLELQLSDFYTVSSFLSTIAENEDLRHSLMSIYPDGNRIPNSLCLHYVLRTSDGYYLLIERNSSVSYEKERVSFSGEEQFKPEDLATDGYNPFDACALRALMEEVYPRLGFGVNSAEGRDLWQRVQFVRCLSFFLEEKFGNYALLCFIQLKDDSDSLRRAFKEGMARTDKKYRVDREGTRFLASEDEIQSFLQEGKMTVSGLNDEGRKLLVVTPGMEEQAAPGAKALHASSGIRLYAIARILRWL